MGLFGNIGARVDPTLNHNFVISLVDSTTPLAALEPFGLSLVNEVPVGGFTECSGIEMTMQAEEYKEGGRNGAVLKFPARISWSPLTLKSGISVGTELWDWFFGFVQGKGRRRDGTITLLDEQRLPSRIWFFQRGLPTKYTGPSLNATQNSVAVEAIEITHEGIYQMPGVGPMVAAGSAVGGLVG
jgi:phage tail-like protein